MTGWVTVERVLAAVESVPAGSVVTYGDVGELVGTSARRVGSVLHRHGSGVPWWRVTNARGELPPDLVAEARLHWGREGIGTAPSGRGCLLREHRADLVSWGSAYEAGERAQGPSRS